MRRVYGPQWRAARAWALAALVATLYCLPALAASWIVEGRVVGVSDGDTITVLDRGVEPGAELFRALFFAPIGIIAITFAAAGAAGKESAIRTVLDRLFNEWGARAIVAVTWVILCLLLCLLVLALWAGLLWAFLTWPVIIGFTVVITLLCVILYRQRR